MNRKNMWLIIIPVVLFILLSVCVTAGITHGFENWAYAEAIEGMDPAETQVMKTITHFGDTYAVIGFCLLLIIIPKARRTIALPVSFAVILSLVLNLVLKALFSRERPDVLRLIDETSYSFPSGHAMVNASLYTMLALMILKFIKSVPRKAGLMAVCSAVTVAIGFTRLYLGVHYAGDIIGGWIIGFAVSVFVYLIWNKRFGRERQP
jgi:undecaprenyl-diphosphatase